MATDDSGPSGEIHLDATNLRGLAHPLRVRALGWLRRHGPATATQLATALGLTSGATSYHLRQLAAYGFVVEVPELGNGRERWWQAAHRSTRFDLAPTAADPDGMPLAEGAEFLRSVARICAQRLVAFTDGLETLAEDRPDWVESFTLDDWQLTLTPSRARALTDELERVVARFRDESDARDDNADDNGDDEGTAVVVQYQLFPTDS